MKIVELIAVDCIRFKLNPENARLHYTPEEDIQVIIGTNGSGKSTLMSYLALTIPEQRDFEKDGYLEINLEHEHTRYRLAYMFGTKEPYSFKKYNHKEDNWEELNVSYKITTQRELIAKEFGITPFVQSLFLDKESFSAMRPMARKQLLLDFAGDAHTYALGVYDNLVKRQKEFQGTIRVLKAKYAKEKAAIITAEEEQSLSKERALLLKDIQTLTREETKCVEAYDAIIRDSQNKTGRTDDADVYGPTTAGFGTRRRILTVLHAALERTKDEPPVIENVPMDVSSLDEAYLAVSRFETLLAVYQDDAAALKEKIDKLAAERASIIAAIKAKENEQLIKDLRQEEQTYKDKIKYPIAIKDPESAMRLLMELKPTYLECVQSLPEFKTEPYSERHHAFASGGLKNLRQKNEHLKFNVGRIEARISEMERSKREHMVSCPNCSHQFAPGYDQKEYDRMVREKEKAADAFEKSSKELLYQEELMDALNQKRAIIQNFKNHIRSMNAYPSMQRLLGNYDMAILDPKMLVGTFIAYESSLNAYIRLCEVQRKLTEYAADADVAKLVDGKAIDHYEQAIAEAVHKLSTVQINISRMTDKIEELQTVIKSYKRHLGAVEETRQAVQELTRNWMAFKELKKAEVIVESKKRYQAKFDAVDSKLTMHLLAVNALKTIEECIATSQTEERVYATLANALSPKSGLIAENIVGFINDFIASMNRVIAEVWAHPLELIPLSFEDGEEVDLDYKFPFVVGEARSRRDDLCQGSLGMEYIFDIAFKLTAMQSLGLKGYPIFLDEFGGNLDDAHKEASVHMIDTIMSGYDISQMFMVSHNVSSYGAFVNSETFVLCNKNLKVQ